MADVGIWMSPEVLAHKLAARRERNPQQAWNMGRWPTRLSAEEKHRLFVASNGAWRGYFTLSAEALYNPSDPGTPYTLLFDTRTWTRIEAVPVKRFRVFTYDVPRLSTELRPARQAAPGPHNPR